MLRQTALASLFLVAGCDLLLPTPTVIGGEGERERPGDEGEGEEGEGEEGEGDVVGEGEGEGDVVGEGEGDVGGEGEGEGEGDGPGVTLHAQLIWSTADGDLDVRGIKENSDGAFCAPDEFYDNGTVAPLPGPLAAVCVPDDLACDFANCRTSSPDWDGDGVPSDGDPVIDVDDVNGLGPENLNVLAAGDGEYLFGGFAFDGGDANAACATMTIFVDGVERYRRSIFMGSGDWVEFARVSVAGASVVVTPLEGVVTACE